MLSWSPQEGQSPAAPAWRGGPGLGAGHTLPRPALLWPWVSVTMGTFSVTAKQTRGISV